MTDDITVITHTNITQTIRLTFQPNIRLGDFLQAMRDFDQDAIVLYADSTGNNREVHSVVFDEDTKQVIIDK